MEKNEKNREAFKRGVLSIQNDEYSSLFWGNVTGEEFDSEEHAFECGVAAVEEAMEQELN